jgi:3-oxoacyl-[acyl-carrier protein] reductase
MSTPYQSLNKKKVLITGGNGDVAKCLANKLENDYVVTLPIKTELDITSIDEVREFFLNTYYDVVINAAGTLYSSSIIESDPNKWIRDINVNLIGTYLVCRQALISNRDTKLINISSTAGYNCYSDWTSYCSSKAGVIKLSGGLYKDDFNVITLCPGAIDTKLRNGLNINNTNVMTLQEGVTPIIDSVNGKFKSGDIIFYRKGEIELRSHD